MAHSPDTTIAAIATPPGAGGIGIIRISGPDAHKILCQIFHPRSAQQDLPSHKLTYGWIRPPGSQIAVDEVLAVYMAAPRTYTREDVVEIHCHGGYVALQAVLDLVLEAGAHPASQGEFTKRAFLNGRIDLTQAEAVIEVLNAKTKEGLGIAMNQLGGAVLGEIEELRDQLIALKATLEVAIDFPDDAGEILHPEEHRESIEKQLIPWLATLIANAERGQIYRDGISVVIIGKPNVGKSSLLNALLKKDRAIVTEVPGTTRDTIEEYLNIRGIPVRIIDTAGIRDTEGTVEKIGIQRSKERIEEADIVLLVLDSSAPLQQEDHDLYQGVRKKQTIPIANKTDLQPTHDFSAFFPEHPPVLISAKTNTGITNLEEALFSSVTATNADWDPGCSSVPNIRHKASLKGCLQACQRITEGLKEETPADLLAIELQCALDHLGDIVGFTTPEDVLDAIFSKFCIGK